MEIKRSSKLPKGRGGNPHAGLALKITLDFQKSKNESKVTSLKSLGKMVSIQRTVPKKAYIHSEGGKDLVSYLAFLKGNWRTNKGEKKKRRRKPNTKFKKKKRKKKTAKDEENPTFLIGEIWTKRLAVGIQNDLLNIGKAKNDKCV